MKNIKSLIAAALVLSTLVSCKKDDIFPFTDVTRVQFGPEQSMYYNPNATLADTLKSLNFVYGGDSQTSETVYFDLYATGGVSDQDRSFTLKQVQVAGAINAVAGQHYKGFDDELLTKEYVVKAGQVHTRVPIVILRDPSLRTQDIVLKFELQENEHFKKGQAANLWRKVIISDRLSKTPVWDITWFKNKIGAWSMVKHRFMINATGMPWSEAWINDTANFDGIAFWSYCAVCKTALIDYNNAHPLSPLRDENQGLVVFP